MKPILIIPIIFFFSCLTALAQNDSNALTFEDFKSNLKQDMDNKTIVETFGQPNKNIGSGICIFVYELSDSTTMIIGCTDRVLYAHHSDKDGNNVYDFFKDTESIDKQNVDSLKIIE